MKRKLTALMLFMALLVSALASCSSAEPDNQQVGATNTSQNDSSDEDNTTIGDDTTENSSEESSSQENSTQENSTQENSSQESSTQESGSQEDTSTEESTSKNDEDETTTEYTGEYVPVTMAFTGDMYLSDDLYNHYTKSGLTGFMSQSILDIFQKTDIMVCNHEYVATDLPDSAKDTVQIYNFKAPTSREKIWDELGVDIVSLANNHAMDFGQQSLVDTLDTIDTLNVEYIGAGRDLKDALSAEIKYVNGKKIAVLASCRFIPSGAWYAQSSKPGVMTTYESTDRFGMIKDEITRLKEEEGCDIVAVFVHFGKEKSYEIINSQKTVAHGYVDAGADFVIGSHAHNLQGIEIYKGAPIYYNLGNFLFMNYSSDTMVVNIKINEDNSVSTSITPCVAKSYIASEATGQKGQEILDFVESMSINVEIDENGNVTEKVEE